MGILKQIAEYLYIKKDKDKPKPSLYIRMMHGMNRISILLFLVCIIILLIRLFRYLFS